FRWVRWYGGCGSGADEVIDAAAAAVGGGAQVDAAALAQQGGALIQGLAQGLAGFHRAGAAGVLAGGDEALGVGLPLAAAGVHLAQHGLDQGVSVVAAGQGGLLDLGGGAQAAPE